MKHGWTAGHNLRLDFRFGLGDPDRLRKYATELVALAPDVFFRRASGVAPAAPFNISRRPCSHRPTRCRQNLLYNGRTTAV